MEVTEVTVADVEAEAIGETGAKTIFPTGHRVLNWIHMRMLTRNQSLHESGDLCPAMVPG